MNNISDIIYGLFKDNLGLSEELSGIIVIVIVVLMWLIIGVFANKLVATVIKRGMKVSKNDPRTVTISKLVISIMKYIVWFIIVLLILGQFGVDITPFIASAGVVGLAVGFGAQELVKDFISGFFIIFEHTFDIDEIIEVDGFKGKVLSLGLRTTVLENWRGEIKTISNGSVGSVINYSRNDSIGIVDFGVSYNTDLNKFNEHMEEFIASVFDQYDDFTEEPQFLGVTELADSSVNMRVIFKTEPMNYFGLERIVRRELVSFCATKGIEIPFPQVVVHNG
jgi:small conductance mechanosensitive channel